jgi:hypothetical protein
LRKQNIENSVEAFLKELYIEDSFPTLDDVSQDLLNGTVAFTHFNTVNYTLRKKNLKQFYMRRCAVIMKQNQPGADICIPVKLSFDEYSAIFIQIKNINTTSTRSDDEYPASARSIISFNYVFENSDLKDYNKPCVGLYWQFGY